MAISESSSVPSPQGLGKAVEANISECLAEPLPISVFVLVAVSSN